MNKKVVFFSTPAYGHLTPIYPVIKRLIEQGNTVDWYCSKKYKDFVESSGANFIEYVGNFDDLYNLSDITANFYNLFEYLLLLNRNCYLEYFEKISKQNVDLILYDSMCSFGKNIALKLKKKHICLCTTLAYNSFTFIFSNMFFSTIKLSMKYFKQGMQLIKDENKYRRQNGIHKLNMLDLFINRGDRTIVFSPKEFQPFASTFNKSFSFVGTTIKDRINLDKTKYENYDVYISLGSIFTENKDLLMKIINSDYLKDKKVIINIGNLSLLSKSKNIEFVKHTNQLELLKKSKLFINHGGLNSIFESIYHSVIQVCIPQQEEQKMNALIVKRLGLGICMSSYDNLKVSKIENKRKYYENKVKAFSKILKKYDGTKNAVHIINEVLE